MHSNIFKYQQYLNLLPVEIIFAFSTLGNLSLVKASFVAFIAGYTLLVAYQRMHQLTTFPFA